MIINRNALVSSKSFLIALQMVVGITALAGGVKLVADPSGGSLGISLQWLSQSPFSDFTLPGVVLFVVIGLGNALASLLLLLGSRHAFKFACLQGLLSPCLHRG